MPVATRIVAVGGMEGLGKPLRTVSVYDPVAQEWKSGPPLPAPRHHVGVASVGGVLAVSGGASSATNWVPEATFWTLQPDAKGWTDAAPMPDARMGHAMVAIGARLYVIGGRGTTSNVLIFDTLSNSWSIGAEMPVRRDHLAAAVVGTRIFAIGGRDSDLLKRVDIYDTVADSWSEGPPLPIAMSAMAAGVLADGIHVVGGEDPALIGGRVFDRHYRLSPDSGQWEVASRPLMAVHGAASLVYDGALIIIGGSRRQGSLSPLGWTGLVQAYSPSNLI